MGTKEEGRIVYLKFLAFGRFHVVMFPMETLQRPLSNRHFIKLC